MINKETLLKKIENGEIVWLRIGVTVDLKRDYKVVTENGKDWLFHDGAKWYLLDELYATREELDWELEFGDITRPEKLELPTWEEFQRTHTTINFYKNGCEYGLHVVDHFAGILDFKPDFKIEVYVIYNDLEESSDDLFSKPLTKENYTKACRLCKKLFLGEV